MAMIKCQECGKQVSDKAAACIHCGCPLEKEQERTENESDVLPQPHIDNISPEKPKTATKAKPVKKRKGCLVAVIIVAGIFWIGVISSMLSPTEDKKVEESSSAASSSSSVAESILRKNVLPRQKRNGNQSRSQNRNQNLYPHRKM